MTRVVLTKKEEAEQAAYWANPVNNVFDLEIRIQISTSDELRTRLKAMTEDELIEFILQNTFRNNSRRVLEIKLREKNDE